MGLNVVTIDCGFNDMATIPFSAKEAWKKIEMHARNAVVYLDAPSAELLHWAGGMALISSCYCVLDLFDTSSDSMVSFKYVSEACVRCK